MELERNGNRTEMHRRCGGDKTATAELAFCFDGTERNRSVIVFMPTTVYYKVGALKGPIAMLYRLIFIDREIHIINFL